MKAISKATILVVDDEPDIRQLLCEILEDEGYRVLMAENARAAQALMASQQPDLILLDIWMPDTDGITLLKQWATEKVLHCPVVMMSGHGSVETAVEATRLGAYDFLEKPLSLAKLLVIVERALEASVLQASPETPRSSAPEEYFEPVGKSVFVERLKEQLKRLGQHDTRVLLFGEPGVGKQLFARYLHQNSTRRAGPFVTVAVGSIASENAAIEFFGREDQGQIYPGLLEKAHGGTLFLGDIADMDLATQQRLLSALESNALRRVGSNVPVHVDVRIIASSRTNLEHELANGLFRRDLYYLLNAVTLEVKPLRTHHEDVPRLLRFYVDYFVTHEKLPFRRFSMAAQNYLRHYPWPGNVRELRNLVQRLLILGAGDEIELDEVKDALGYNQNDYTPMLPDFFKLPLKDAREHFEKSYLEYHLEKHGGSVAKLAAAIGMERTHLYRKLHALNIKLP